MAVDQYYLVPLSLLDMSILTIDELAYMELEGAAIGGPFTVEDGMVFSLGAEEGKVYNTGAVAGKAGM